MFLFLRKSSTTPIIDSEEDITRVPRFWCGGYFAASGDSELTKGLRIYGGGYTLGSKDSIPNANGLVQASQADGSDGIIFVAMNYRLGALGWLSGPSLQDAGGVSNAGLYDQRLAIEWVVENIHLFGGDPNRITLIGESAGGESSHSFFMEFHHPRPSSI